MRKTLFNILSACLLLIAHQSVAQSIETFDISKDEILVSIRNQLPDGWTMSVEASALIIEKKGPFIGKRAKPYIQDTHPNPAPRMPDSLFKQTARFRLPSMQLKMAHEDWQALLYKEGVLSRKIDTLYKIYDGIQVHSGKTEYHFYLKFPTEEKRKAYELEKRTLRLHKINPPDCYSSTYSYSFSRDPFFHPDYKWSNKTLQQEIIQIQKLLQVSLKQYTSD